MQVYYDAGGGCFDGECITTILVDNSQKLIKLKNIKKGDILLAGGVVKSVVKIVSDKNNKFSLINFMNSGLLITPNHPLKINNVWIKPYKFLK